MLVTLVESRSMRWQNRASYSLLKEKGTNSCNSQIPHNCVYNQTKIVWCTPYESVIKEQHLCYAQIDLFLLHLMYLYGSDMTAAIIKPITTIMSLSPNLFSPPVAASVCNHDFPPSAMTDSPCGGCGHSMWVTWGAAGLLHYLPPFLPSSPWSCDPAPHTTDRHLCSNIQQQSL